MIIVIDYDTGNTKNVQKALDYVGLKNKLSSKYQEIQTASGLILPGVGAFSVAMQELKKRELVPVIEEAAARNVPILGVCLGMQLLLEGSEENGFSKGLGLIEGFCKKIPENRTHPVPHVGWNNVQVMQETPLTKNINGEYVYFVHSYYAVCPDERIDAVTQYTVEIPVMISKGTMFGAQFHPEKSSEVGLGILRKFKGVVEDAYLTSY